MSVLRNLNVILKAISSHCRILSKMLTSSKDHVVFFKSPSPKGPGYVGVTLLSV